MFEKLSLTGRKFIPHLRILFAQTITPFPAAPRISPQFVNYPDSARNVTSTPTMIAYIRRPEAGYTEFNQIRA